VLHARIGRINASNAFAARCMINAAILRVLIMQSVINYLVRAERRENVSSMGFALREEENRRRRLSTQASIQG
jgi:hypothetical protein